MKNKINFFITFVLCILLCIFNVSCDFGTDNFFYAENQVNARVDSVREIKDFISPEVKSLDKYTIVVIADVHTGSRTQAVDPTLFYNWLDKVKAETPEKCPKFCLSLGDVVDHGFKDEYTVYKNFSQEIEKKGVKFLTVLGNHDLYNSGWEHYKKDIYPYCSLFRFQTKNLSWYGIDTGTGNLGEKQYELLQEAFAKDKNPKVVMMHYPMANDTTMGIFSMHDTTERNLLLDLCAKNNVKTALCGHLHQEKAADLQAFPEYGHPSFRYSDKKWTWYQVDETKGTMKEIPVIF